MYYKIMIVGTRDKEIKVFTDVFETCEYLKQNPEYKAEIAWLYSLSGLNYPKLEEQIDIMDFTFEAIDFAIMLNKIEKIANDLTVFPVDFDAIRRSLVLKCYYMHIDPINFNYILKLTKCKIVKTDDMSIIIQNL